ncbi:cell division protein FtsX [Pararhizobium mangrovi]|uniref:ABC transporter permease n=1 Tax=Pararhizobium mangrovi TaxID=2590452 RepID=A0A506U5S7_9HYPH|nr:ABC transporter permease [Pararhizobium mangrovi]TPW27297.1 ABC transporter permease [Pararhizobium mangrovi]
MAETATKARVPAARGKRPKGPPLRPTGPIVPVSGVSGNALVVVVAIMAFLACLTLGAVTMIRQSATSWQSEIAREVTIQIKPEEGLDMDKALARARSVVTTFAGVTGASVMGKGATARLLQPWLGSGIDIDELPVPRLVVVTIDERDPPDFQAMRAELNAQVPQARLDDHRAWVDRLTAMANTTVLIGLGVLGLVMTATVLTVIFATRSALSGNRHIVEVLHFVGAETRFVASQFQRHFFRIGLKGGLAGGVLAAGAFFAAGAWQNATMGAAGSAQTTALFGRIAIGPWGYLGIALVVAVVAAVTALTTRLTVMRTIRHIDRARADGNRAEPS